MSVKSAAADKSEALAALEARFQKAVAAKDIKRSRLLKSAVDAQAKLDAAFATYNFDAAEALEQEVAAVEAQIAALAPSPPVGLTTPFFPPSRLEEVTSTGGC